MEPNPLAIFALCLGGASALIFLLWLNHKLRGRPKSTTPDGEEHTARVSSRPIGEAPPTPRPSLTSLIMSLLLGQAGPIEAVAEPLPATSPAAGQPIATPGNAVNEVLPGNVLPEEAREVVRFWAMVEAAERLIASGKVGQTEAIETVFGVKRSGRPESVYARARVAIQARETPRYLHPLSADQQELRKELALE